MKTLPQIKPLSRRPKLPPIYDKASHWYKGWYFELRLEEELARSIRYSLPLTLVSFYLTDIDNSGEAAGI